MDIPRSPDPNSILEVGAMNEVVHAADFGWVPGVLNMSAAQAAIDAAVATGKTLVLGNGTYLLDVVRATGEILRVMGDGTGSLTIVGSGATRLEVVTQNAVPEMIEVINLDYFELNNLTIDGNKTHGTSGPGSTVSAEGVRETHFENLLVVDSGSLRAISSPGVRADLLVFGNLEFDQVHGATALITKHNGIDRIVQNGPVTVRGAAGGFTFDSDPYFVRDIPDIVRITNETRSREFTITLERSHDRQPGDWIEIEGADQAIYNGRFQVKSVTDNSITIEQALTAPSGLTRATGEFDITWSWGPNNDIRLTSLYVSDMRSSSLDGAPPRGQVRGVKLEDGIGTAIIHRIVATDCYATSPSNPDRSSALHIGAGAADLPVGLVDIERLSGTRVGDVLTIVVGRDDFGRIDIERLYASHTHSAVLISPVNDFSPYREGHGLITTLRIGHLILDKGAEAGIVISDENAPVMGNIIDTLIIERVTNASGAPVLMLLPGSVGHIIGDYDDSFAGTKAGETIDGRGGRDLLIGKRGWDVLIGGTDKDRLFGGGGGDTLYGDAGYDRLFGGSGNDKLFGGKGPDVMTGDAGSDVFMFSDGDTAAARDMADIIADFRRPEGDSINLEDIDGDTTLGGDQKFKFIGAAPFTGTAGELRYAHSGGDTFVAGDTNGDGTPDFSILLTGLVNLTAADFVL